MKVIPKLKKDFRIISWHGVSEKFDSLIQLKLKLLGNLGEHLPPVSEIDLFEVGYLEGRRQTKRWIVSDADIIEMYTNAPNEEHEILLWCDGKDVSRKRKPANDAINEEPAAKRSSNSHEEAIEEIAQELEGIHGEKYVYRQYKLWARMIENKQHKDKNTPPNMPMIMGKPVKKDEKDLNECISDCVVAITNALGGKSATPTHTYQSVPSEGTIPKLADGISPGKKVNLRSQYLSQLKTLQALRDDGVLTNEEFCEEKISVLNTLKTMK